MELPTVNRNADIMFENVRYIGPDMLGCACSKVDGRQMGRRQSFEMAGRPLFRNVLRRPRHVIAYALAGAAVTATCVFAAPPAIADQTVTPQTAQGYWSFEKKGEDGTYVNEGTKKDLKLTVSGEGAKVEASDMTALGNSLNLADKSKDFDVKVAQAVDSQKVYSISMWLKSEDSAPGAKTAILQFTGEGRTLLYQRADGEFVSFVGKVDSSLGSDPKRGSWEHLVLTKTGDPKNVTLYVNGEKNGSGTWTETLPAGMMDLLIGEHKNPNDMSRFQGKIDELCVFDSALTEQQVKQLYASYGDITIADELARDVEAAQKLYDDASTKDAAEYQSLKVAIDKANAAIEGKDVEAMKAAKAELAASVAAVRALGATITVDPSVVGRAIDDSLFGINHRYSNYGYGTVNADGTVKDDFAALYKQAGFGSLRYPGGTISNNYVWTESIGDLDPITKEIERTPQIHGFYNNQGQAGFIPAFGLLEVAEFAEQMNSEIIMVYGIGRGDALDAADMVEFLNAEQGTNPNGGVAWADKRAELGHPEPFGIRYFEIGNENNQGGDDGTASQQYWMPNVNGGALEGYVDGGTATFNKQYAVIRGDWNVAKSYSTGEKDQEFACRYALIPRTDEKGKARDAVVKDSVKVYVGDELWSPVDNIKSAKPGDKVYQLDMTTGFFTFGDGEHGAIPEKGKQIKVDYQVARDGFIDISQAMRSTMEQINKDAGTQDEIEIYTSWEADNFVDKMHEKNADALYDGMAVHPYTNKVGNPANNDNTPTVENKTQWYLDVMRLGDGVANNVQKHVDYMRRVTGDNTKVPVISEYGIFRSTNTMVRSQTHALYIARAIMEYAEQGSPYIQKHCLVDYYSSGADSLGPTQQAVIQAVAQGNLDNQKDGTGEFKFFSTPSAHIFQMLNGSFGSKMVGTSLSNEGTLSNGVSQHSVMASTDENGTVYIAIVNLGLNDVETAGADAALSQKVTLAVNGMDLTGKTLKIKTLAGDSFYQENDLANPENLAIEERTEEATGATYELELAPHSFTIVAIGDGSEEPPVDPDPEPEPEPTVYTIKLMLDGEPYKTIDVVDGKLSEELPVLTREGWVFEGWFYEDGTAFDSSRPIEGDLVLSAKWTKASTPDEPSEKPTDPKPTPKPEQKPQGGLPQTGDASTLMVAGGVAVGVATTIAGARARKRRV